MAYSRALFGSVPVLLPNNGRTPDPRLKAHRRQLGDRRPSPASGIMARCPSSSWKMTIMANRPAFFVEAALSIEFNTHSRLRTTAGILRKQ